MIDLIKPLFSSDTIEDERFCNHEIEYMGEDNPKTRKMLDSPLIDPEIEDEDDKYYNILDDGCIYCGNDRFLQGPSGGMCVNVKCDECGQKYNLMPMGEKRLASLIG